MNVTKHCLFALALALPIACARDQTPSQESAVASTATTSSKHEMHPNPTSATQAKGLSRVADRSLVCMVNDQYMGRAQIPVAVEGKTYYGCCPMCKDRLAKDAAVRTAVDPLTKKTVDKADAVIAKTDSGSTLYFEDEQNFMAYAQQTGR